MQTLNGTNYIIQIDTDTPITALKGTDSSFRPVMCTTSNNFGMDFEGVSFRNKMDGGWDRSKTVYGSWSADMNGFAIGLKMADKLIQSNFEEIAQLAMDFRTFWYRQSDLDNTIVREGLVRIASYKETADLSSPYSFSVSFVGVGKPIIESQVFKQIRATINDGSELRQDGNNNLIEIKNG